MDDFTKTAKLSHESLGLPVLVIVERQVLMRTLIVSTFKRELRDSKSSTWQQQMIWIVPWEGTSA